MTAGRALLAWFLVVAVGGASVAQARAGKTPGTAFSRERFHRAPDFRPAFQDTEERIVHGKRSRHEHMTAEERESTRRSELEGQLKCDSDDTDDGDGVVGARCHIPGLQASLMFGEGLSFCVNCRDPHETGSLIDVWEAHYGPVKFHVDGRLTLAVPNDASMDLLNRDQVRGRIALVHRGGEVSLLLKVLRLQDAGASAAVIMDLEQGGCDAGFDCGRLGKRPADHFSEGFAAADLASEWRKVHIPTVLVLFKDGQRLLKLLDLGNVRIPGFQHPQLMQTT